MRKRNYAPMVAESLEERVVLSNGVQHFFSQITDAARDLVHLDKATKHKPAASFGALGDSLSDEYLFYGPDRSQARNWVELLAGTGRARFGRFTRARRAEPRDAGFANNWARSDATSSDMVADQLPGLTAQVQRGRVRYVNILVGENDFGQFLQQAPALASDPLALNAKLDQVEATAESNLNTAVTTLLSANPNVRIVVGTIFELGSIPGVQARIAPLGPQGQTLLQAVDAAIGRYNSRIRQLAAMSDRVAVADLATITANLAQHPGGLQVHGVAIDTTTPGDAYNHVILADGVHPGTVAQGFIANAIIDAANTKFDAGLKPLRDGQLIHLARNVKRLR